MQLTLQHYYTLRIRRLVNDLPGTCSHCLAWTACNCTLNIFRKVERQTTCHVIRQTDSRTMSEPVVHFAPTTEVPDEAHSPLCCCSVPIITDGHGQTDSPV